MSKLEKMMKNSKKTVHFWKELDKLNRAELRALNRENMKLRKLQEQGLEAVKLWLNTQDFRVKDLFGERIIAALSATDKFLTMAEKVIK